MATTLLVLPCCLVLLVATLFVEIRAQNRESEMTILPSEMTVLPASSSSVFSTPSLTSSFRPTSTPNPSPAVSATASSSFSSITPSPTSSQPASTSAVHPAEAWTPEIGCLKSDRGTSIKVEASGGLQDFSLLVMNPAGGCNRNLGRFLGPITIPERCVEDNQVEIALQLTRIRQVFGGRYFRHFLFSCSDLGPDGKVQELSVSSNPDETEATAQNSTFADGSFELLVVTGRQLRRSAVLTSASSLDWSQDDVFLVLRQLLAPGSQHRTIIPLKCQTSSSSHPNRLTFWLSKPGEECTQERGLVDDWTIRPRKTATEDVTYCPMYPFDFRAGEVVTITCSIRECPDVPNPAQLEGKCKESYDQYQGCRGKWYTATRRFRRAISSLAERASADLADDDLTRQVSVSFVVA